MTRETAAERPLIGRHALVTGANRGIGAETVRVLSSAGADVTLMVRDRSGGESLARTLKSRTHIVLADVTDHDAVRAGCQEAETAFGPVDILVNNAGSVQATPFLRATPKLFEEMFAVHVLGAVVTSQAVLSDMVKRRFGRIVNVASIAGLEGAPYVAHYVTAKHALVGLTRALAAEYASKHVTVNAICPGYTQTDIVSESVQRIVDKTGRSPEEALQAILADAGQSRLVTVHEVAQARVLDPETRLDGAEQDSLRLWLRLFTCTKLIEREVDGVLKREFGSSLPRFDLLAQLDRAPGGLRMGELSARTLSSGGNITWLVAALERDGLVTRRVSQQDKRAAQVKLTVAGRRHFGAMAKVHEALIAERFGTLCADDRRTLHALLGTVKQRVTSVALVETT